MTKNTRNGIECTEVAISLPLLMIVMFSAIQICHYMHTSKLLKLSAYEAIKAGASKNGSSEEAISVFMEHTAALGIKSAELRIDRTQFDSAKTGDLLVLEGIATTKDNRLPAPFNINLSEFLTGGVVQYRKEGL